MGKETTLTADQIRYILMNRLFIPATTIARQLNVGKGIVSHYLNKNGMQVDRALVVWFRSNALVGKTTSTPAIDSFLTANYLTINVKQLAALVQKSSTFIDTRLAQLGLIIPPEIIEQRKIDSRRKPGDVPVNKGKKQSDYMTPEAIEKTKATRFKKGNIPHNGLIYKDGDIAIRNDTYDDGTVKQYKWIRLSMGNWQMLHVHNWIKAFGQIPQGHIVIFKDKDSMNCEPDNLMLVTREEHLRRNYHLTDKLLAFYICGRGNLDMIEDVKQNKTILDIKRSQIIINRTINNLKQQQNARQQQ